MGSIGTGELILVLVVALVVLGPDKLPGVARQVGNLLGELRRMSNQVRSEVDAAINNSEAPEGPPEPQKNKKHPGTDGFELIDKRAPDAETSDEPRDPK